MYSVVCVCVLCCVCVCLCVCCVVLCVCVCVCVCCVVLCVLCCVCVCVCVCVSVHIMLACMCVHLHVDLFTVKSISIKLPMSLLHGERLLNSCTLFRVDWIEMQGNKYCVDDVIWVGFEDELPKFGKIYGIILMMSHMFFTLNLYITKRTDHHHNSFLVQKSAKCILKQVTEDSVWMGKQHSLETHQLSSCEPGTFHIVTKYFISNLV